LLNGNEDEDVVEDVAEKAVSVTQSCQMIEKFDEN
jgi:hypothetical protein